MLRISILANEHAEEMSEGLRLLLVSLAGTCLFHGGLLPFTHANTYDAFIHMFFADHYNRNWFDVWEPRWYTGFATTSYPPGTHMLMGALQHLLPLRASYVVVQLAGLLLLTLGVFRFALLWVPPRAAGYATVALLLSSSVSETVHLFGQLPTIFSLGIFLNGMPFVFSWIVSGGQKRLAAAVTFAAATTAAHHVTSIFGGVLFVLPLGLLALRTILARQEYALLTTRRRALKLLPPVLRGLLLAALMIFAVAITVFPYWHWSVSDPITQVPIPHGSRESFLERPDLGFVFFLLPWGVLLLLLPYVVYKTFSTYLWPLGLSVLLCLLLGTGGTTPLPQMLLRGAFDILTLDRFTFWATILVLPFIGLMFDGLLHGRSARGLKSAIGIVGHRSLVGGLFVSMVAVSVFCAVLPSIQPTQPRFIDPAPIVRFLSQDEHDRWRYLTLGFGDQFAYLSAQTTAQSVDGNYHSARRLPELTRFSVERLENAKYMGVPGLGSLRQFVENPEKYHLKYVFSNDAFYDPLLHFSGWTRLNKLENGVTVWERPDVIPLPRVQPRRPVPEIHQLLWAAIPPVALLLAAYTLAISFLNRGLFAVSCDRWPAPGDGGQFSPPRLLRAALAVALSLLFILGTTSGLRVWQHQSTPRPPEKVIEDFFAHLDQRRFVKAFDQLDPETRGAFEDAAFPWRWRGGLIASYGKLETVRITPSGGDARLRDWTVKLDWLTALDIRSETYEIRTVEREGRWYLTPIGLSPLQTPVRLQRQGTVAWNVVGRRQPRPETDLHRDRLDRPRIAVSGARLVARDGTYHVIGQISNADVDPANVTLAADLTAAGDPLIRRFADRVNGQRLLPSESAGFRVDFEAVLSLDDARQSGAFDPNRWVPPELAAVPDAAAIEARALVHGKDLYRGVVLNGVRASLVDEGIELSGLSVNTGTETATISRINVLLYGPDGRPLWADAGFVDMNIYPGQSAPFRLTLPPARTIEVVADIGPDAILANGSRQEADLPIPGARNATLAMPEGSGYATARLHVTSMTHDPLF